MVKCSDGELIKELSSRLEAKDKAYEALMLVTKKVEALNQKLLDSEKVKSQFLSNIRNEINNPLTAVLSMCELLLSPGNSLDQKDLRSAFSMMHRESFKLNFQLRNIFIAAELEAGEAQLSPAEVDVIPFFATVIDSFRQTAAEKGIVIRFNPDENVKASAGFHTDAEKLERVIANLVSNAIEFSPAGFPVEVGASFDEGNLSISVSDSGPGIDEEEQLLIFERFRQLNTGPTKEHAGHGLGLSIVKALVEFLSGKLRVASRKGAGSVFSFVIPPLHAAHAEPYSPEGNDFFFGDGLEGERF